MAGFLSLTEEKFTGMDTDGSSINEQGADNCGAAGKDRCKCKLYSLFLKLCPRAVAGACERRNELPYVMSCLSRQKQGYHFLGEEGPEVGTAFCIFQPDEGKKKSPQQTLFLSRSYKLVNQF